MRVPGTESSATLLAQRQAQEPEAATGGWAPDPTVTVPVLRRVEDELAALLDLAAEPQEGSPAEPMPDPAAAPTAQAPPVKLADGLVPTRRAPARAEPAAPPAALRPSPARRLRAPRAAAALAVVLVLALTAVAVGVWSVRERSARAGGHLVGTTARQDVVALALAQGGQVSGVSLLASGAGPAQQVLVPSRLVLDVPGAGRVPIAQALAPGPQSLGAALSDALDIRVDATWVLDRAALARLVDAVGGVVVDVDVDVTNGPDSGSAVVVSAGPHQRLSGAQAAAYAQLLLGDEPEPSRLARQERVLDAVLGALPTTTAARRAMLAALPDAPTGAGLDTVVRTLGRLRADAGAGQLASTVLPVTDIDAGAGVPSYGLDALAAAAVVKARLAGAMLPTPAGGVIRVLVQNGVGTPGLGEAARSRLVAAGLRYVSGGNLAGFGVDRTLVLLPDGSSQSRRRGHAVVQALGLSDSALRVSDAAPSVADVVVMLGKDFRPR